MQPNLSSAFSDSLAALYQEYAPLLLAYLRWQVASLKDADLQRLPPQQ